MSLERPHVEQDAEWQAPQQEAFDESLSTEQLHEAESAAEHRVENLNTEMTLREITHDLDIETDGKSIGEIADDTKEKIDDDGVMKKLGSGKLVKWMKVLMVTAGLSMAGLGFQERAQAGEASDSVETVRESTDWEVEDMEKTILGLMRKAQEQGAQEEDVRTFMNSALDVLAYCKDNGIVREAAERRLESVWTSQFSKVEQQSAEKESPKESPKESFAEILVDLHLETMPDLSQLDYNWMYQNIGKAFQKDGKLYLVRSAIHPRQQTSMDKAELIASTDAAKLLAEAQGSQSVSKEVDPKTGEVAVVTESKAVQHKAHEVKHVVFQVEGKFQTVVVFEVSGKEKSPGASASELLLRTRSAMLRGRRALRAV